MTIYYAKCVSPIYSRHNLDDLSSLPYFDIASSSIRSVPSLTQANGVVFIPSHWTLIIIILIDIKEAFLSKS